MISCQRLHRDPRMSHFKFALPGNHIPLLHTDCPGLFRAPHTNSTCSFTFHQHSPGPTALPGSGGTHPYVSKLHLLENKSEVCSADNNARLCRGKRVPEQGWEGNRWFPVGSSTLVLRWLRAFCECQLLCHGNPSSHPTYSHGSHRYKKEIPSLPAALREEGSVLGRV